MVRVVLLVAVLIMGMTTAASSGGIRVVTEEWPPYTCSENGEVGGVVTEVVRAALDRAGVDYSIEVYPWARAYDMARTQENVLIYSICRLPAREDSFKWIRLEGLSVEMYLFSPKYRNDIFLNTLEDAKRYRIGVTRETSTHHFLLAHGFVDGKNLFPVNCEEQNELKSSSEVCRIDLTTGDKFSLAHLLKKSGKPSDYLGPAPLVVPYAFAYGVR